MVPPNGRKPWAIAILLLLLLLGLLVGTADRAEGAGQRCGRYEAACLQAMADFGFGYDPELLAYIHDTIHCESRFDPLVRGHVDPRDRGLVQINSYWHPEVSDAEAFDPVFSIRYMVWQWSRGNASQWACYVALRDRFGPPAALRDPYTLAARSTGESVPDFAVMVIEPRWLVELHELVELLVSPVIAPLPPPFWAWRFP
jgi:hypothetical protein